MRRAFILILLIVTFAGISLAEEARMLRYPDIHGNQIIFVYGSDIWTVSSKGGIARRLTSDDGQEIFPKFSPDGKQIAFTGSYDGNADDIYVMPSVGGDPKRITYHPGLDSLIDWYPDGKNLLFRAIRNSFSYRFDRLHKISAKGGFPEVLALPEGELSSFNADATKIAYNRMSRDFSSWKRYRGGMAQDIWVYDFENNSVENITDNPATDAFPMWQGDNIYFISDREESKRVNLYKYDVNTKETRKLTNFQDYDVKWPSQGPGAIVFENGGWLYVLDLRSGVSKKVDIEIFNDKLATRPVIKNVQNFIQNFDISPTGKRALFEARGDIFTVPAEKGDIQDLTETPGIRERNPIWSPDGKWIAYFSDKSGEFQIYIRQADGQGEEVQITNDFKTYFSNLTWSPDSKKILFSDATVTLHYVDIDNKTVAKIDHDDYARAVDFMNGSWSPDSNWITYAKGDPNGFRSIFLYSLKENKTFRVTGKLTDDREPAFDPEGKYLFWIANREFNFGVSAFEINYYFRDPSIIVVATLQADTPDPFAPESDEETVKEENAGEEKDKKSVNDNTQEEREEDTKKNEETSAIKIDLDGLESRMVNLPIPDGTYLGIVPVKGNVIYISFGPQGNGFSIQIFDMMKRMQKEVISAVSGVAVSADGKKILYRQGRNYGIVDARPGQKPGTGMLNLRHLEMTVDYLAEWRQMFYEAWRQYRDFFYDRNMHGVDWEAMKKQYEALLPYLAHRDDLNYLIGELIGELNSSHAYRGGGDYPHKQNMNTGVLACDFEPDLNSGYYKITKIYRGQSWDPQRRSPLIHPGIDVKEGDYLISVDGRELKYPTNPWSYFVNTVGKTVTLRINSEGKEESSREVKVNPIASDQFLRYIDWVMENIEKVNKATGGRIGYIHVPDTALGGMEWFNRLFYAQVDKEGLIVDARYNSGGFIPDMYLERLARRLLNIWVTPYGKGFRSPSAANVGPKVCITNHWAGSGGDAFPYYFRELKIGPVIGTRTWGGLIGYSGNPILMDNGSVTIPDFAFVNMKGEFDVENQGVTPDIVIDNRPDLVVDGHDPQLEKAIELVMKMLKEQPNPIPNPPLKYPIK